MSYDVDGQIIAQHWKQGVSLEDSLGYEYDSRKQLTKWINPQGSYTQYAYDNVGNRVTTSQYDATSGLTVHTGYAYELGKNRLMKRNVSIQDTTDYSYYQDGSMKRSQFATYNGRFWNNKIENYGYGYNGLLTSYSLENTFSENVNCFSESGSFAWVWTYRYSPGGERESKRLVTSPLGDGYASHNWNYYLLGGNKHQLAVYNGRETSRTDCYSSGNRVYFYPTEYLTYGNGSSALMTTRPNGNQEYKVTDHLGSTRVVVDSTGYILSQYDYEPFGKPLAKTGLDSRKSYIDKEKDYESGLGNYGVRSYDDDLGRLTTTEPLWEKLRGWSLYQYSYNNPLRFQDGNGKLPGDLFTSPNQAAHDFGKNYNPISIESGKEFGSSIYEVKKDGQTFYSYSVPTIGEDDNVFPSDAPDGTSVVGLTHTHGAYKEDHLNNYFSNADKSRAKDDKVPIYLTSPNGTLQKYDPNRKTQRREVVSKDMPRDSKDPTSKKNKTPPVKNSETRDVTYQDDRFPVNIIYEKKK